MTHTRVPLVLGLLVGVAVIAPGTTTVSQAHGRAPGAITVPQAHGKSGVFNVRKECSTYEGQPGQFCTITSSDIREITVGSQVFYTQPAGIPDGVLDSNVVLDAGGGNRAVGRCTLDLGTGNGLCTFSDGTGHFRGFHARVDVFPPADGINWRWLGKYEIGRDGGQALQPTPEPARRPGITLPPPPAGKGRAK